MELSDIVQTFQNIATAINEKGIPGKMKPAEIPEKIHQIPVPEGNVDITDTNVVDVTNYATAKVVDTNLVSENIKKDVNILGIVGTHEGGRKVIVPPTVSKVVDTGEYVTINVHSVEGADVYYYRVITQEALDKSNPYGGLQNQLYSGDFTFDWRPIQPDVDVTIECQQMGYYYGLCKIQVIAGDSTSGSYSDPTDPKANISDIQVYCFIKGTEITLADKRKKLCQDISYDDELLVWDFDKGRLSSSKPIWIKKEEVTCYYYESKFSDGTIFKSTGTRGHRVFSIDDNKFVYNTEAVGKRIFKEDGSTTVIVSTELKHDTCEFYNIITDRHLNLFANRLLTSTHLNNLYPIKDMKFIKNHANYHSETEFNEVDISYVRGMRLCECEESAQDLTNYANHCWESRKII